jgi:threonine dehydrogenase-like Zn-dependent dehydrogenase
MYDLHSESIGSGCHKHITASAVHITSSTHSSTHMPFCHIGHHHGGPAKMKRVDPTLMTTHTFPFDEMEKAFEIMDKKLDGVLKPLIAF